MKVHPIYSEDCAKMDSDQYHVFVMGNLVRLAVANVDQRLTAEQAEDLAERLHDAATEIKGRTNP